jgi:1-phosphatidylinositol-4-phosphate 5-kinase
MGVSQVLGSLLMGDLTSLSELVSEGKSGSFFYFSYDQRYMVKTISSAEARTLRRTLQEYHEHVKKFPVRVHTIFGNARC